MPSYVFNERRAWPDLSPTFHPYGAACADAVYAISTALGAGAIGLSQSSRSDSVMAAEVRRE